MQLDDGCSKILAQNMKPWMIPNRWGREGAPLEKRNAKKHNDLFWRSCKEGLFVGGSMNRVCRIEFVSDSAAIDKVTGRSVPPY